MNHPFRKNTCRKPFQFQVLGGMAHDERADLYSLGVLTWLLFTGGMPGSAQPPVQPRPEVGEWKEIGELLTKTCAF